MILDRLRLSAYVGADPSFEAQFLVLLLESVTNCIRSLDPPNGETYHAIHAAKPGLIVATTESFALQLSQICDVLLETPGEALTNTHAASISGMLVQLRQLSSEIQAVLERQT